MKNAAEEEEEERYSLLPVEECAIHPLAKIRFEYQVDELSESIAAIGQVQPGKAVEDQAIESKPLTARYLVYIGCRRLLACKNAGVKQFKALVVRSADEHRILTELLTENMKRANLSVLEELNLLANYFKTKNSLEDLARDVGLSPKLMRARANLAVLLQDKGMIQTLYKVERVSGFRFTHRQIEKIAELEEARWLPLSVHAAERNWKAEDIEELGTKFTLESLVQTLPAWGRQFVPNSSPEGSGIHSGTVHGVSITHGATETSARASASLPEGDSSRTTREGVFQISSETRSRYQTLAKSAQFLICPRCGSETSIEFPVLPPAMLLKPSKIEKFADIVALDKESIPILVGAASVKCSNEKCGRTLIMTLDQSGDGQVLSGRAKLLSLVGSGLEPENGGVGDLVWDGKDEAWLKVILDEGRTTYLAYDERARKWVIPVRLGEQTREVGRSI
jgi:ParB/RepB/Spo0J family partition protein